MSPGTVARVHPGPWDLLVALSLVALLLFPVACEAPVKRPSVNWFVEQYLRLAVALGERDPDSLDFYFGPEGPVAQVRLAPPTEASIAQEAAALRNGLDEERSGLSAPDMRRADFLRLQLDAIRLRAEMLSGAARSFDEEGRVFFDVRAGDDLSQAERKQTRMEIGQLLGSKKDLAHSYSKFDHQFVVSPDRVAVVMAAALQQCRTETLKHIALPAEERVDVHYVYNKPWSGFSRYMGHAHSVIQINLDFPLTVDRILNLACHEGYPGHHVFNTMRDQSLVGHGREDEWLVQPTYSPQSMVSEAAASYAAEVVFTPDQRLRVEHDVLFPLAGLDAGKAARYLQVQALVDSLDTAEPAIARDYLDGNLEFVRAASAFEHEMLMEHAETLLLYLNEYRSYMLTYTVGRDRVRQIVEQGNPSTEVRWRRYTDLMKNPVYSLDSY